MRSASPCGSELAREGVVSVNIIADCANAIASKLVPQVQLRLSIWSITQSVFNASSATAGCRDSPRICAFMPST